MLSQKNRRRFWFMYVLFAFLSVFQLYSLLGRWMLEKQLHAIQIEGRPYISDFVSFYGSGVLARQCLTQPTNIYDSKTQIELESKLTAPIMAEAPFSNPNTPVTFVTFLPLTFFNLDGAWIFWTFITTSASVAVLLATLAAPFKYWFAKLTAVVGFLVNYATWFSIRIGSTSLLLFPMMLSYWHFLWQGRCAATAAIACVATMKLQYAPFLLSVAIARLGWKFAAIWAAICSALLALCTAVLGWNNVSQFPSAILANETTHQIVGVHPEKMQNLRGILVLLTGSDSQPIQIISGAVCLITASVLFFLWKRIEAKDYVRFNLLASATTLLMLLSSPHTHTQDYIIAFIPCLMLYLVADRNDTNINVRHKFILKFAAISFPYASWAMYVYMVELNSCKIQPFAVWALALTAYTLTLFFKGAKQIDGSNDTQPEA